MSIVAAIQAGGMALPELSSQFMRRAYEQKPADERREVKLVGERPDLREIRLRGEHPARLETRSSGRCSHAVKLSAPPRTNKHHCAA